MNNKITSEPILRMLIISPLHDLPTVISHHMADQLKDILDDNPRIDIDHINFLRTHPSNITRTLSHKHYNLIVYYGHGIKESWRSGFFNKLVRKDALKYFKNTIVITMSCFSAATFGRQLIKHGCRAFIGNTEEVYGAYNSLENSYSTDFIRIWQMEVIDLLRGFSVRETVSRCRQRWYNLSKYYSGHPELLNWKFHHKIAFLNARYHIYRGNGSATLPRVLYAEKDLDNEATRIEENFRI